MKLSMRAWYNTELQIVILSLVRNSGEPNENGMSSYSPAQRASIGFLKVRCSYSVFKLVIDHSFSLLIVRTVSLNLCYVFPNTKLRKLLTVALSRAREVCVYDLGMSTIA